MSFADGGYSYTITTDTAQLKTCRLTGFSSATVIPEVVIPLTATNTGTGKTYNITAIGNSAFFRKTAIKSITITDITVPFVLGTNSLTIGDDAFSEITALTTGLITIPKRVASINGYAFYNTPLTRLEFAPNSNCTTIGDEAFANTVGASTLVQALTIPNTVTAIGDAAFGETQITSLTIEDINANPALSNNTLTIGRYAFFGITTLTGAGTTITIPTQVTVINRGAFNDTTLTSLVFTNGSKCTTIGFQAFLNTTPTLIGTLTVPETLTSIGPQAFVGTGLETLTLVQPTTTLAIESKAFLNVSTLNKPNPFALPPGVTAAADAFQGTNLVTLPFATNGYDYVVTSEAPRTCMLTGFTGGTVIPEVTIPLTATNSGTGTTYNVTAIGNSAFAGKTAIESITITEITDAFVQGTNSLIIGLSAFSGITALTGAGTAITIPKQVVKIYDSAFLNTNLTSLVFTNGSKCTTIGANAFKKTAAPRTLVDELAPPASLTSIGAQAFVGTGLTRLTLVTPTSPLLISAEAFLNVDTLTLPNPFALPPGVTAGADAFKGTGLVFTTFAAGDYQYTPTSTVSPFTCTLTGFSGAVIPAVVVPLTATNAITGTTYNVTSIGNSAFENTAITSLTITNITTSFVQGANSLTIGDGAFSGITTLASAGTTITIPTQVTSIGNAAFIDTNLTSLVFTNGSKCTTIGNGAFTVPVGEPTLAGALVIPNTVTSIGDGAFYSTKIIALTITDIGTTPGLQENELTIGPNAFRSIITLTAGGITIPSQVTSIGEAAFKNTTLTSLEFAPNSKCTTIGQGAFRSDVLSTLEDALTIPNTVTSIGSQAFTGSKITSLTITDIGTTPGLQENELTIGPNAFRSIITLTAGGITIPKQVVSIGDNAFADTNLLSLEFTAGSKCTTIGDGAFSIAIGPATLAGPLTIPNTVTSIGNSAFASTKITVLTITDIAGNADLQGNELTIGQTAFAGLTLLTGLVTIPTQVVTIGGGAFGDTNLTRLEFTNGSKCTTIGNGAFATEGSSTLAGALTIPNTVTSIGEYAFSDTQITALTIEDITTNATLNANELTIGQAAFSSIATLTGLITIPTQVVSIGASAFKSTALTGLVFAPNSKCATIDEDSFRRVNPPAMLVGELAIPASLTSIGQQAFVGTGLVTLKLIQPATALQIQTKAFLNVSTLNKPNPFFLPAGVTAAADAFEGTNLVFGPPTPGQTFTSDNNLYLVTSTAPLACTLQGFSGASTATLTVPATVTSGGQAYTVTAIAANAYKDNAVITTLLISAQSKLTTIGPNTFEGALNLTLPNPLTFPATIQVIGANAFAGTGLTIIYPADMQQLANGARSRASVAGRLGST